jgi:hypothetical protein
MYAWLLVLWLHACLQCAWYGLSVYWTVPMVWIPLVLIGWARERREDKEG